MIFLIAFVRNSERKRTLSDAGVILTDHAKCRIFSIFIETEFFIEIAEYYYAALGSENRLLVLPGLVRGGFRTEPWTAWKTRERHRF